MKKLFIIAFSIFFASILTAQEDKDETIQGLRSEIQNLMKINDDLRAEINRLKSQSYVPAGEEYRIQLGVQNSPIRSLSSPKVMSGAMVNGKMVYDIGGFKNPNDAFSLSQELRKLNLGGAFVTRYINGNRDMSYRYDSNNPTTTNTPGNSYMSYNQETGTAKPSTSSTPTSKSKIMQIEE